MHLYCLQLQETLQELEKLLTLAQNQKVKDILSREVRKVQTEIAEQAKKAVKKESETQAKPADQTVTYTKEIKNYGMNLDILLICYFVWRVIICVKFDRSFFSFVAWDQTTGMMKIYITDLKDVQKLPAESITSEFGNR